MRNPMLELVLAACLSCGMLFAGGPNNYQGPNNGDWSSDANWSQGHVPRPDEDVGITGVTVNAPGTINVMSLHLIEATLCIGDKTSRPHVAPVINGDLELEGSKLYVYAGELMNYDVFETEEKAMAAIRAAANIVTIGGDFTVDDTSVVYPECGEFTGVPVIFKVGGEFTLAEGASFNVTRRGWAWSTGLWESRPSTYCKRRMAENKAKDEGWTVAFGAGLNYNTGGRYGGNVAGTKWSDWTYGKSYGPTFAPIFPGSPGGMYISPLNSERGRGPGSIVVLTTGAATINGVMDADGTKHVKGVDYEHSGTSGGGIWLTASAFTFGANAKLTAEGGGKPTSGLYGVGGGGRIALAEGCTAEQIDAMFNGTLPDNVVEATGTDRVAYDVLGGLNNAETARGTTGSFSFISPKSMSAVLDVRSTVEGLTAEGVVWGEQVLYNGEYSMTAPQYAYLASDPGVRYRCAGFVVSNATTQVAQGDGLTAEFEINGAYGPYTLTWRWDERMVRVTGTIAGEGSVTYDGTTYTGSLDVYLPSGESCAFTATPSGDWRFSSWAGTALPTGFSADNPVSLAVTQSGTMDASFAQGSVSRVWVGPQNGSWDVAANWSPTGIPGELDDLYLTNATLSVGHGIAVRSLTLSGASALTVNATPFVGASTPANIYANATVVEVSGALVVDGTSVITAANDPVTGAAVKIACGTFYLGPSAKVTASEKGWFWYDGTNDEFKTFTQFDKYQTRAIGAGNSYTQGGGYGAIGGNPTGSYCQPYGYKYAPFLPGSPNGCHNGSIGNAGYPGGTVWIVCDGLCELYGSVTSDGQRRYYGATSGGSVWICAKGVKAAETTSVSAIGGYLEGGYSSYGAGGRVSLALGLTDEQLDALAAGEEPEGLTYTDVIDLFAVSVRGGEKAGATPTYGNNGTATTVVGPLAYVSVTIAGSPVNALGVEPANGLESYEGGTVQTFTAPEFGADPINPLVGYDCEGYVVSNALGEVTRGAGTTVDVTMGNGPMSVVWQWGAAQMRVMARKPANGSLAVDGMPANGDAITWTTGRTPAIEAVPDEGYEFLCWEGNVPFGQARENPLVATIANPLDVTPVFRLAEEPMERTWSGTGVWTDASKWSPANMPGPQDTVVIASGTCAVSNCLAVAALRMTGGALNVGTKGPVSAELSVAGDATVSGGTLTLGYGLAWRTDGNNYYVDSTAQMTGHARFAVGGDLALGGKGSVVVCGGPIEGDYTFATGTSFLAVGGGLSLADTSVLGLSSDAMSGGSVKVTADSFTVAETAKVDALGRGYAWLGDIPPDAPGLGYSYTIGGSHGGQGGGNSASSKYDFELSPVMPGSPNGSYSSNQRPAGGVIRVHARTMSIEGTLTADSVTGTWTSGSAGGSIWLTADRFAFGANAVLTAVGGASNYSTQGGGGRIAISRALRAARLEQLVETGVYSGPSKRVKSEAEFRALYGNETMTIGLGTTGSTDPARLGTFTYLDDLNYATLFFVK